MNQWPRTGCSVNRTLATTNLVPHHSNIDGVFRIIVHDMSGVGEHDFCNLQMTATDVGEA